MELAMFVAAEKQFAPPSQLLRFYFTHLTSKPVLTRFTEDDQSYVISNVARILTACEEPTVRAPPTAPAAERGKAPSTPSDPAEDAYLRRQILDVCGTILQVSYYLFFVASRKLIKLQDHCQYATWGA